MLRPSSGLLDHDPIALAQRAIELLLGLDPPRVQPLAPHASRTASSGGRLPFVRSSTKTKCAPKLDRIGPCHRPTLDGRQLPARSLRRTCARRRCAASAETSRRAGTDRRAPPCRAGSPRSTRVAAISFASASKASPRRVALRKTWRNVSRSSCETAPRCAPDRP